jgi:hypothetical protein
MISTRTSLTHCSSNGNGSSSSKACEQSVVAPLLPELPDGFAPVMFAAAPLQSVQDDLAAAAAAAMQAAPDGQQQQQQQQRWRGNEQLLRGSQASLLHLRPAAAQASMWLVKDEAPSAAAAAAAATGAATADAVEAELVGSSEQQHGRDIRPTDTAVGSVDAAAGSGPAAATAAAAAAVDEATGPATGASTRQETYVDFYPIPASLSGGIFRWKEVQLSTRVQLLPGIKIKPEESVQQQQQQQQQQQGTANSNNSSSSSEPCLTVRLLFGPGSPAINDVLKPLVPGSKWAKTAAAVNKGSSSSSSRQRRRAAAAPAAAAAANVPYALTVRLTDGRCPFCFGNFRTVQALEAHFKVAHELLPCSSCPGGVLQVGGGGGGILQED